MPLGKFTAHACLTPLSYFRTGSRTNENTVKFAAWSEVIHLDVIRCRWCLIQESLNSCRFFPTFALNPIPKTCSNFCRIVVEPALTLSTYMNLCFNEITLSVWKLECKCVIVLDLHWLNRFARSKPDKAGSTFPQKGQFIGKMAKAKYSQCQIQACNC